MTKYPRLIFFISLSILCSYYSSYSQTSQIASRITQVENKLLVGAEIIFADSAFNHFNIYDRMKFYKVPSVSIAVINNGQLEWAKAYGLADVSEKRVANTNTVYQAASLSKSLNAFCIMKLVQEGKLTLDIDIRQYLKSWTFPDNESSKNKVITLKNLLSHTAGLSLHGFRGYSFDDKIPTINDILNGTFPSNNEALKPIFPPNTTMKYSGGGTLITKKILDDNISANYDNLMRQKVLKPLGMSNSSYAQPLSKKLKNVAVAYDENLNEIEGKYNIYPELAPDGLWTTPTDFSKFIISIQHSLKKNSNSLLNDATIKEMLTPVLSSSDAALGVFIKEKGGEKYFTHSGANIGYRTEYYGSFTTGAGLVIMVNSDNGQIINEIKNSIATVYNWKGFYTPEIRKLVNVPDTIADKYIGEYYSEKPQLKITIAKKDNTLHLSTRGKDYPERMLFVSTNKFYLPSSPSTFAEFKSIPYTTADTLVVKENNNILFKAVKISPSNPKAPDYPNPN